MFRCTTFHIAALAALLASSCQSPPKPLSVPAAQVSVDYEHVAQVRPKPPQGTARLMELYAVSETPTGTPIALAAAAIVSDRGTPFRGKTQLPTGSRWLSPEDLSKWRSALPQSAPSQLQKIGMATAVLQPHLLTSISVGSVATMPEMQLQHADSGLRATLSTEASDSDTAGDEEPDEKIEREVVVLADAIGADESVGLFIPDTRIPGGGLLLVAGPSWVASPAALTVSQQQADSKLIDDSEASDKPMAWRVADRAVGERNRRPALLAVVTPLQLPRAADLILASDEPMLIAMTDQLDLVDATADNVSWSVESAVWQALIPRMERDQLTPALQAATTRHLGAIFDDASTLMLLLKTSRDDATFSRGLIEENLAALADRSAAIRVAAVAWLKERNVQVDGYDAMGNKADRRRAVRRYLAAQEEERLRRESAATEAGR